MVLYETSDGKKIFDHRILFCIQNHMNDEVRSNLKKLKPQHLIDSSRKTLLHYSVTSKNLDMVKYCIARGCDVNAKDIVENTPLMLAVNVMDTSIVKVLLKAKADIFARDSLNCSPLQMIFDHPLVGFMHDIMKNFMCALEKICNYNPHQIAKKLIEAQCPLPRTVCFGNIEVMKSMLQQGCFVDSRDQYYQGCTALKMAVMAVDLEAVKLLLQNGADINAMDERGQSVLHYYGPEKPETEKKLEILRTLIDYGATFNLADKSSASLAMAFLAISGLETVKIILRKKIDLQSRCSDENGICKPLFFALASNSHKFVIDELRERALDFNLCDTVKRSALYYAITAGNSDAVEFFLKNGTDPNIVDDAGETVLLYAFRLFAGEKNLDAKKVECVELLLQYNADTQFKSKDGTTLFGIALQHKDSKLTLLFLQDLAIRQALGKPVDDFNLNQMTSYMPFVIRFTAYKDKIVNMQKLVLCGSITVFKLLTENKEKVLSYMRIKQVFAKAIRIRDFLTAREGLTITPYSYLQNVLIKRLNKAIETTTLREKAITVLSKIERLHDDPYVISMIVLYLDDNELRKICKI